MTHPIDWEDPEQVGTFLARLLSEQHMEFFEDHSPYYSPRSTEERFDSDLASAAHAEGLSDEEIAALLRQCHSDDPALALDAYRDIVTGRWKVCPAEIPHWSTRPDTADPRLWLPDWAAKHRQGLPF
jgi:hypothetical protein